MIKKSKKTLPTHRSLGGGRLKPKDEGAKKTKIRVIGIGGGGCSIVSEIAPRIEKATFVAANTNLQDLKGLNRKVKIFPFGQNLTHGLGTGMDPQLGEMAALNDRERIKNLFKDQDLVILIASLGGGTSSGATPIFAKIAKSVGCLTYGVFTLPFKFEGKKKMEIAQSAFEKLKPQLNALSIIPNERIFQIIDKDTPLKGALSAINQTLAENLEGLLEVIYQPGLINIDFADLKTILEGRGKLAYLNVAKVEKKAGVKSCIEKTINSPLYPYSIQGAKGVLYNIAGEKNLNLEEISQISKTISELSNPEAKIIFGISQIKKYHDLIKTTLLATGLSVKIFSNERKKSFRPKSRKKISKKMRPVEKPAEKKEAVEVKPPQQPQQEKLSQKPISKLKVRETTKESLRHPTGQAKKTKKSKPAQILREKTWPGKTEKHLLVPKIEVVSLPAETQPKIDSPKEIQRKNALQIKKEADEAEREIVEKEKIWETPAFLRKKFKTE